ncbi:hypothetical protein ACFQVC_24315 [Streptomyces monticola]|uniref:Uncharacterized protein n=1 Tax=Streptomyces monticola TaxID=2666263 RepID=A0ABW2JNP5_9ACTN
MMRMIFGVGVPGDVAAAEPSAGVTVATVRAVTARRRRAEAVAGAVGR